MKKDEEDEEELFYNKNRKIKPGLTANKSICFLVEAYPKKIQKFAMSFLLNEFVKDDLNEKSSAPYITPKCKKCGVYITFHLRKKTGMCTKCCPTAQPGLYSILPPPKNALEEAVKTMLLKDIAEHRMATRSDYQQAFEKELIIRKGECEAQTDVDFEEVK